MASQRSTQRIEDIRTKALRFFNADPDHYDLIFVANATAGIKLVMEAFREKERGFWYGYHADAHTSLLGVREAASVGHRCFMSDGEVDAWLEGAQNDQLNDEHDTPWKLFAYPAQSNMHGRRLPMDWPGHIRSSHKNQKTFSLLDAASLVSTSPLDLSNHLSAPDFTVMSFYKIFGFPDLGALIVRKQCGHVFKDRQYFGGGTVEMVSCGKENWHISKHNTLHDQLEDGTAPIHSIFALGTAFDVHTRLYGSMEKVAVHTESLTCYTLASMVQLHHYNGRAVCEIYSYSNGLRTQLDRGPIIAFNLRNSRGSFVSNAEVEKLASVRKIQLRSGGLCNPGGIATSLKLAPWEMKRNFAAGQRCGNDHDIMDGKPTGMLRISFGAMSNLQDVSSFIELLREFFVEKSDPKPAPVSEHYDGSSFYIESLMIYPIKSCGGMLIPGDTHWRIRREGLAWDREWCLVHLGTRQALSQKKYPRMSLIKPIVDLEEGLLRIRYCGIVPPSLPSEITVPLSEDPTVYHPATGSSSTVCDDSITALTYASLTISTFLTTLLDTPCTLARFPPNSSSAPKITRHAKPHLLNQRRHLNGDSTSQQRPNLSTLLLSNESPILVISRSSLNRLNEHIKRSNPSGKAAHASVFRANIILAEENKTSGLERPYAEDDWSGLHIQRGHGDDAPGNAQMQPDSSKDEQVCLDIWGGCRRCQMVCVDQMTATKDEEPFVTLAKTRRELGKGVLFGVHAAVSTPSLQSRGEGVADTTNEIRAGDRVWPVLAADDDRMDENEMA